MVATLSSLGLCTVFIVSLTSLAFSQEEEQFIYHGFNESKLHLEGLATIHPNGLLQLTNSSPLATGHALYPFPFKFNNSSSQSLSFSTNFVFAIVTVNGSGGHGMAFVISPSMVFSTASATEYLGLLNITNVGLSTNHIIAVELDTVQSVDFDDIDGNHVGIDVNNLRSYESAPAAYFYNEGRNIGLNLQCGNPIQIWIEYNEEEKLLNVTLAPIESPKPNRPVLSTPLDLSQILLDSMYVGFSSSTGTLMSDHYILGWSFNRSGQAQTLDISKLPPLPPLPPHKKATKKLGQTFIVLLVAAALVLTTIITAIYIVTKNKYEEVYEEWEKEYGPHRWSFKNLWKATKGFNDEQLVGEGGFGRVYKGVVPSSNEEIAVKRVSHHSNQGVKQFVAEIVSMRRLRHRNLVQLRGYCRTRGELMLVYEYMTNGSLDKFLYDNNKPNLNWFQRFRILREVASGLLYLHEGWEQVVLHRDIKPGNVLLDAGLNAKLGDFGLARSYDHGTIPQTTMAAGTPGYMAPELMTTGKASPSTDVYAFGVFMLEVACGRKPLEQRGSPDSVNLVNWVAYCWRRGALLDARDQTLGGIYVEKQTELVLKLGLFCSHPNPAVRPSMREVMRYLDGDARLPGNILFDEFGASNQASHNVMMLSPSLSGSCSAQTDSTINTVLLVGR